MKINPKMSSFNEGAIVKPYYQLMSSVGTKTVLFGLLFSFYIKISKMAKSRCLRPSFYGRL
jgi:hypothetical protein